MTDVLIIGCGPAGVSAALYAARGGLAVTVLGQDGGALAKADKVENFYGHAAPVSGRELIRSGHAQLKRLGVALIEAEAVGLRLDDCFTVETAAKAYEARGVILATGANRAVPPVRNLAEYEGGGVSYCAVCDAFFYRGKPVAVLGGGAYAAHEVNELLPVAASVTVLTDGSEPAAVFPQGVDVVTEKIAALSGAPVLEAVCFESGRTLAVSGLFVAAGVAGSTALAKKLGAQTKQDHISVDASMRTDIDGLWAAGDCTGGMKQIAKAVYEGAVAGTDALRYCRGLA